MIWILWLLLQDKELLLLLLSNELAIWVAALCSIDGWFFSIWCLSLQQMPPFIGERAALWMASERMYLFILYVVGCMRVLLGCG
uniref:Uncharacterized protein n=1 Tax=Aegilops tauschii subsp. strangulata TaxID=200361 RepID=A0A452XND0_AEGTS